MKPPVDLWTFIQAKNFPVKLTVDLRTVNFISVKSTVDLWTFIEAKDFPVKSTVDLWTFIEAKDFPVKSTVDQLKLRTSLTEFQLVQ